ncbi:unnamed protein product [Symbiodinium necroappetens]|uniref:Uncharacterized protein n=1 Tax=Symbiodinium necroappetens TaxID=1628268 RepID=A0A812MU96_9DINO|nr:unnamed protein product [Symbiodinium necroappetens]
MVLSLRLLVKTVRTGVGAVRWQRVPSQTASFARLEGGAIHGAAPIAPSVPFVRQERMGHTRDNFNRMLAIVVRLAGGDQNQVGLQLRTAAAAQWVRGAMSSEQACFCSKECFWSPPPPLRTTSLDILPTLP